MTTIPATSPASSSGSSGSTATSPSQGQQPDGQPTFSDALSQAQGHDQTAQGQNSGALGPDKATSTHVMATSMAGKEKSKTEVKSHDQLDAASQQGPASVSIVQPNPVPQETGIASAASLALAVAAQSGKALPQQSGKAGGTILPPPVMALPQAMARTSAGQEPAISQPVVTTLAPDRTSSSAAQVNAALNAKTLPNDHVATKADLFQAAMSAADQAQTAKGVSADKLAQALATGVAPNGGAFPQDAKGLGQHADPVTTPLNTPTPMPGMVMPGATPVPSTSPAVQPFTAALHTPVGAAPWGQELGQQLLFAVNGQQQLATLHLNPPQLGPLEVHLMLHNGQIDAQFVSQHQAVRQALESAMPQLHDMFTGAGLSLMQTSVNSGGNGRGNFQNRPAPAGVQGVGSAEASGQEARLPSAAPSLNWKSGLVNTYV